MLGGKHDHLQEMIKATKGFFLRFSKHDHLYNK